jgi:tetratricopeptide (TPR) repeat protein
MPEVLVASLDPRHQKLVENARVALDRGNFDYVIEVTSQVLKMTPGCLPVRKLQRVAQVRQQGGRGGGLLGRTLSGLSMAPFLLGGQRKDPEKLLARAEAMLAKDPMNVAALKLLAEAAGALGLLETVAFAFECVREIEPENRSNLLALGEAWCAAGKPAEALKIADEILRTKPTDADAQVLMRKASIAKTVTDHNWDQAQTSFRDKLRDGEQAVSLEQAAKIVTGGSMTQRLLDEALARVAKEPGNLNHYRSVAQAYRQQGNLPDALEWIRKAREQPVGRADVALEKQETELAVAIIEGRVQAAEAALALAPGDAALAADLEATRRELAAFKLAELKRTVERYPNDFPARHALAVQLLELNQVDAAIAQFQQAQKGPTVRVAALVGLGRGFKLKRLYDLAAAQFMLAKNEITPLDETKKEVIYELASCYDLMGKPDAAIEEFKVIYSEDIGFRDVAEKINAYYAKA